MPDEVLARVHAPSGVDPMCDMSVDVAQALFVSEHGGRQVFFCAAGCQKAFEANPELFAST